VYRSNGTDGQQTVTVTLGSTGQFTWNFTAAGVTICPGTVFAPDTVTRTGKTSGALTTQTFVSTVGAQVDSVDRQVVTPVTFNPGVADTALCLVELSPDNTTWSAVGTETLPVGAALDGSIRLIPIMVPGGWWLRFTVTNAVLADSTVY
jgi:hypothetical protein